jgi:hypothetical protein
VDGGVFLRKDNAANRRLPGQSWGMHPQWRPDSRRFLGSSGDFGLPGFDTRTDRRLGTLFPTIGNEKVWHWLVVGPEGHWRGPKGVEDHIVYVALHEDGSQHTYSPTEFAKKFGWKNDPAKARLLRLEP